MRASPWVSLQRRAVAAPGQRATAVPADPALPAPAARAAHPAWDAGTGWKHHRTTLRLLLQPSVCPGLLLPWPHLLSPPHVPAVQTGLATLGSLSNTFHLALPP